jgi:hypothetical protein
MATMQVQLNERTSQVVQELASELHETPEDVAEQIVTNGIDMMRRYAYLKKRSETVDVEQVIKMLRSIGNENPPDAGDELPEELKYLLTESRP